MVLRAGAGTFAPNLTGSPVRIPRQTGSGTVYWVGQNADITKSDASYGEVQMTPKTMAMRMQFSNLLNLLSNPAIEQLIRNDFALSAALS
ncbi:MAG: phage major capsid protein [Nitrospiraceae bacterium]